MHQVSRTVDSITLSWSQPDQPNGVILDYELQYYEKVPVLLALPLLPSCQGWHKVLLPLLLGFSYCPLVSFSPRIMGFKCLI